MQAKLQFLPLIAFLAGCGPAPEDIAQTSRTFASPAATDGVNVPPDWRQIPLGDISFAFPDNVDLGGYDNICGGRSAPDENCLVHMEGPVLEYEADGLTLRTRDDFGYTGPSSDELGTLIRVNDVLVHRRALADGRTQYVVTAGSGGRDGAPVLWRHPDDALLWLTCRTREDCATAKAIAGSVEFISARELCQEIRTAERPAQQGEAPPAPPAPYPRPVPPPPLPEPPTMQERCSDILS